VPVAFLSGDDHAVSEAKEQLGNIVTVVVKTSMARDSICSLSLNESQKRLEQGAKEATEGLLGNRYTPFKLASPLKVEVQFYNQGYYTSLFQKLCDVLNFDNYYQFDEKNYVLCYTALTPLEVYKRLNLILYLMFGLER